jgi:hypothetical protein
MVIMIIEETIAAIEIILATALLEVSIQEYAPPVMTGIIQGVLLPAAAFQEIVLQ